MALTSRKSSSVDDLAEMLASRDHAERWERLVKSFAHHGLIQVTYGLAEIDSAQQPGLSADLTMSTMTAEQISRHFHDGCLAFEPLLRALRAGRLDPMPFDIEAMEMASEMLEDMRAAGLKSGALFPLPPQPGCPVAGLIAASRLSYGEIQSLLEREGQRLVALTHLFHSRASSELMRRRDGVTALTAREKDCLQIISRGERVAAVAHILGLSEATVELHLRNARRKLGARSLPEAVARGLLYRQIEPL